LIRSRHVIRAAALLWLILAGTTFAGTDCRRVVAIGDIHGGYEAYLAILKEAGVLDESLQWKGDDGTCLVQLGDIVDRGARSREILDLLIALQQQAPRQVRVVLGNHEAMNMVGDLRYTAEGEFRAFADEETPAQRRRGFMAYQRLHEDEGLDRTTAHAKFDYEFPPGWFAHREAFSPHGYYGSWLLDQDVALILLDTLFVHGGLSPADAARGIDALNKSIKKEVTGLHRVRDYLVNADEISALDSYRDALKKVAAALGKMKSYAPAQRNMRQWKAFRDYWESKDADFIRSDGPLWNRDLALADESEYRSKVDAVLDKLSVRRIVVGHTTQNSSGIGTRFDNRVFLIDTGAGPAYGGIPSALEIRPDGTVTALYLDRRETLVPAMQEAAGPASATVGAAAD
jgi:3',5'-cyclic AMP phosphodiesterase CpdA